MTSKSALWAKVKPDGRGADVSPSLSARALPCVHEGAVIEWCKSCGPSEERHVRDCDVHERCTRSTVGPAVRGCDRCPDYAAGADGGADSPHSSGRVSIPEPPRLDLRPTSRTAVVTVAVGEVGRELLAASGPAMARFARRVGADFVVLDWPGHPAWPMSAKFAIPRALDHYERIVYADADVLFRPGCVNPFDLCGPTEFGACDELPWQLLDPYRRHGVLTNYERTRRETGLAAEAVPPWYFNLGVYVASAEHRPLLDAPTVPVRPYHCGEQDLINARVLAAGTPVRLLDRRANWQNWTDAGFRHAPADAVLHWSGGGHDRTRRVADMRERANS